MGLTVKFKKTSEFETTEEFKIILDNNPKFKVAFSALTPGRQRAYFLHFAQPKRSKSRTSRIEKCMHRTLAGKGLNDL